MSQAFISWSGGKDSCFACYRAIQNGFKACFLLNMVDEDGARSRSHGLPGRVLQQQSRALGIPRVTQQTSWESYEAQFKKMLRSFKADGVENGVFGDIDLEEHREWVERVCREEGITPHLPLWGRNQDEILKDFIGLGFEAIIVAARADLFDEEWLGNTLDLDFIRRLDELKKTKDITPCGEAGEYHTLVVNGPLFKQRVEILETGKLLKEGIRFLDIKKSRLRTK